MWTDNAHAPSLVPQRIGVFIDYWYSYETARSLFAEPPGSVPPPWFGNVPPVSLARHLVKMALPGRPRSTRVLAGTHVVIAHFDPARQRAQADRVRLWEEAGGRVTVCPSPSLVPGHRKGVIQVALASLVAESVASGTYDTAIVVAADPELFPLFKLLSDGGARPPHPSRRVERAAWVAEDRTARDGLAPLDGSVWCHRLGDRTFRILQDDRSALLARARRPPVSDVPPPPVQESPSGAASSRRFPRRPGWRWPR